jgi:transcriptional regulator with XRE-family HTH domain
MARRGDPEDLAPAVTLLRALRGWSQKQLADASGVAKSQISRYERGDEAPSRRTQERLAAAVGLPTFLLDLLVAFVRRLRESLDGPSAAANAPAESRGVTPETQRMVLEALDRAASQARAELKLHAGRRAAAFAVSSSGGGEPTR